MLPKEVVGFVPILFWVLIQQQHLDYDFTILIMCLNYLNPACKQGSPAQGFGKIINDVVCVVASINLVEYICTNINKLLVLIFSNYGAS